MIEPTTPTGALRGAGSATGAPVGAPSFDLAATASAASPAVTEFEVVSTTRVPEVTAADEIAALVLAVEGVVQLHPGRFGEVATYLPGRRVAGVKLSEQAVEVHVVLAYDTPIRAVAQQIHAAVAAVVDVPVQVYVEDLAAGRAA